MLSIVGRKPKSAEGEQVFNRIADVRESRDLSRQEFAAAIGVHYQTVGYLERGEYSPSLVLALKIAEIELLREAHGITPVLLLDDVSSELDPRRNARLFDFLAAFDGQTFITTTDLAFLPFETDRQVFRVEAGRITPE